MNDDIAEQLATAAEAMQLKGQWCIRASLPDGRECEISRNGGGDGWAHVVLYDIDSRPQHMLRCSSYHEIRQALASLRLEPTES